MSEEPLDAVSHLSIGRMTFTFATIKNISRGGKVLVSKRKNYLFNAIVFAEDGNEYDSEDEDIELDDEFYSFEEGEDQSALIQSGSNMSEMNLKKNLKKNLKS